MEKIVSPDTLMCHEAPLIEGQWQRFSDQDLGLLLPTGVSHHRAKAQLASGELVLLTDSPQAPLYSLANGQLEANTDSQITTPAEAVSALNRRFLTPAGSAGGAPRTASDNLSPPPELEYTPEPVPVTRPTETVPPPVTISENFSLPPSGSKVFAKSCTRPHGDTHNNDDEEKATNFGSMAMLAPAMATSAGGLGAGNVHLLDAVAGSARRLPLNWGMAARMGASLASGANVLLLAFWPAKLADGTLYTPEELEQMDESAIRVRFQLYEDDDGRLQVAGYHTGESSHYGDRVKVVQATAVDERFEVAVDDDLTLVWYPDESGNRPRTNTAFPADTGIDPFSILVRPIEENGQEIHPPVYPNPAEEQVELIVSFPADSGIEPLYLVFRNTARNESGVVAGYGEDVTGIWLEQASEGLGAPVPSQIADRLRGREFSSFDRFREAFWIAVSENHELFQQFSPQNQIRIRGGKAPKTRSRDKVGKRNSYEIHHLDEVKNGGRVYDIDNLRVNTPKNHIGIHKGV